MKTLKIIFLILSCAAILSGCSKSDLPGNEQANAVLKSPLVAGTVIPVGLPNGVDDTEALKAAFAAAISHGPGAVVQLEEGEYNLGFIEVREFCGTFKGAGTGKSVITSLNDLDIAPLVNQDLNTYLIKFVGGNVYMSDMTVKTPPGVLTSDAGEWWIEGLVSFCARNRQYASNADYIEAVVNNVDFISGNEPVSGWKSNCNNGITVGIDSRYTQIPGGWPLSPTDITITNCKFTNFDIYGVLIEHLSAGNIIVGTKNNGNIFTDNSTKDYGYGASTGIWHNVNVDISVVDNIFNIPSFAYFGIELTSAPWLSWLQHVNQTKTTVFNIEGNQFNITGGIGGVFVNDYRRFSYADALPMLLQVKNNHFEMSEGAFTAMGCFNLSGAVIRNNQFSGNGSFGVRIMRNAPVYNENGLMLGNNFSNSAFSVTTVLLNTGSRNWTIVGGDLGELVSDYGENNLITGFNMSTADVPLGETIMDNIEDMRVAIKSLKGN